MQRCKLEECCGACCLNGVWVDLLEVKDLLAHSQLIIPNMPANQENSTKWFEDVYEPDDHSLSGQVIHSRVISNPDHYGGTACVFLRNDHKCALQVAGDVAGYHPWRFKPFYCILHPLDLDSDGLITLDSMDELLGEAASCLRPDNNPIPIMQTFEAELRYLLGDKTYEEIIVSRDRNSEKNEHKSGIVGLVQ
jgi:hypothetical protein